MSEIIKKDNHIIVVPGKDIVVSMEEGFKNEVKTLVLESSCDIIIDLKGVRKIDSLGIGVIISAYNSLKEKGKKLKVINVPDYIYDLFSALQFDDYFIIEKTS